MFVSFHTDVAASAGVTVNMDLVTHFNTDPHDLNLTVFHFSGGGQIGVSIPVSDVIAIVGAKAASKA